MICSRCEDFECLVVEREIDGQTKYVTIPCYECQGSLRTPAIMLMVAVVIAIVCVVW